jgi:hypothetical protein
MKALRISLILPAILGLLFLASCSSAPSAEKALQDESFRSELFDQIAGNHEYMTEFMQKAMNHEHGKMMMMQNKDMMAMMMQNKEGMMQMMKDKPEMMQGMMKNMMAMCRKDSSMYGKMGGMMMQDKGMMKHMMTMMHEKGMMSKDCMMQAMNKMKDMPDMEDMDMGHDMGEGGMEGHEH